MKTIKLNKAVKITLLTIVLLVLAYLCFITLISIIHTRQSNLFSPSSYHSKLEIEIDKPAIIALGDGFARVEKYNNSGSANGYVYKFYDDSDNLKHEIIACGDLYFATPSEDVLIYMVPDYESGTTSCSRWVSGKFIEHEINLKSFWNKDTRP